ncbi:LruC domain-containing protein [Arcticibacter pallidicorallinus]|nr:LruC domain-containing protein [Arcticibacter pallidicorallinus]
MNWYKKCTQHSMKMTFLKLCVVMLALSALSCQKNQLTESSGELPGDKVSPEGFNYSTTKKVALNIRLLTRTDQPLKNVLVSVYDPLSMEPGEELTKVLSDADGYVKATLNLPAYLESIVIDPAYIGLARKVNAYIAGSSVTAVIGGANGISGNIMIQKGTRSTMNLKSSRFNTSSQNTAYIYDPASFDELGRPLDREPVDQRVDMAALIQHLGNTIPEGSSVPDRHPEFLNTEAPTNLTITRTSDVWITFVHEGAEFLNSLGYYTYPTGQKPTSADQIDTIRMILPNASMKGSQGLGNLLMGDKVKIGRFKPGTSVGFVLIQNAYQTTDKSVNYNATKFYTDEHLNPETNNSLKRHNVLLNDASQRVFLVAFEDINRTPGAHSDQDFNDLVFYAQSNPVDAISPTGIPFVDEKVVDTDGDGVPDLYDEYPEDPKLAYNRYYPSKSVWGTLTFEDMWPAEGDYDLNDLVISYQYKFAMNANNNVVHLNGSYKPLAAGASFSNGFGVQLPLTAGTVKSVSGQRLSNNYIRLSGNGTEANQSTAVIIPFDSHKELFASNPGFINTVQNSGLVNSTTVDISITFHSPLQEDFTARAPFNPFLISNQTRGREVHLVNHLPTDLADKSLLSTQFDNSNEQKSRYYLTKENKPFALDIFGSFDYPVEKKAIYDVYAYFSQWALSGGVRYADWYADKPGYRNKAFIFFK